MERRWLFQLVLVLQLLRQSGASYGNCSCFESQDNITFDNGTTMTQEPLMCNCLNRDNSGEASCAVSCKDCLEVQMGHLVDDLQRGTTQRQCDIYKYELDCFPGSALVLLSNGSSIKMSDLEIGDEVAVAVGSSSSSSGGGGGGGRDDGVEHGHEHEHEYEYSAVHLFTHRQRDSVNPFVAIHATNLPAPVMLTAGHYLYVNGGALVTARQVKVGDVLVGNRNMIAAVGAGAAGAAGAAADGGNDAREPFTVTKVEMGVRSKGLYNPHTLHGDIVVNGVVASTLTDAVHPTLAHILLWPARTMFSLGVDLIGNSFDNGAFHAAQPYMPKGKQVYEA